VDLGGLPVTVYLTVDLAGLVQALGIKAAFSGSGKAAFAKGLITAQISKEDHIAVTARCDGLI
jgi:hypothetical protein